MFPAIATAFSTDSSIVTLPVTMECVEKNIGVSKSRNKALKLAKGKYVAFIDADDLWMPNKLKKQTLKFLLFLELQDTF